MADLGTVVSRVTLVTRAWIQDLNDYFYRNSSKNVKSFGAVGDGVTDDTAAIVAALAAAAGHEVIFPKGVFLHNTAALAPANNTTMRGTGRGSILKATVLQDGGTGYGQRQIDIRNTTGVRILNLTLDSSAVTVFTAGVRSILAYNSTDYEIRGCYFRTPGAAVASVASSFYAIVDNDVSIESTDGVTHHDGIIDQWEGCHDFSLRSNRIRGNTIGTWGFLVTGNTTDNSTAAECYNFEILGNRVYDVRTCGIWAQGRRGLVTRFTIAMNLVDGVTGEPLAGYGYALTDCKEFVFSSNLSRNTYSCGVRAYNENATYSTHAVRDGVLTGTVVINANTGGSTNIDTGSAITVTDASQGLLVADSVVRGSLHRHALYIGTNTSSIDVSGDGMQAGVVGTVLNAATASSTNRIPGFNTYTVAFTGVANVTGTPTSVVAHRYKRFGQDVEVRGGCSVTPTAAASTDTQVGISLPIASTLSATTQLIGHATSVNGAIVANIYADIVNNRATLRFLSPTTSATQLMYQFKYVIA